MFAWGISGALFADCIHVYVCSSASFAVFCVYVAFVLRP